MVWETLSNWLLCFKCDAPGARGKVSVEVLATPESSQ